MGGYVEKISLRKENGVALIIALIMLLILTLIGISSISTTTFETKISGNERVGTNAFYASEAVIQLGLNQLPVTTPIDRTKSGAKIGEDSYGWSGTPQDKGDPKPLQYIGPYSGYGFELSDSPTSYVHTPGNFSRYQINGTGESFGATKEIEAQVKYGPF